jgi:hypothetical protein
MDEIPVLARLEADADVTHAWHCGEPLSWTFRVIRVGTLADGRPFVALTGRRSLTLACRDEARALEVAGQWMTDGARWIQSPVMPGWLHMASQ